MLLYDSRTIQKNYCIPFCGHLEDFLDLWTKLRCISSQVLGLEVVQWTTGLISNSFSCQSLSCPWGTTEQEDQSLALDPLARNSHGSSGGPTFAHDDIIYSSFHALVIIDKRQDKVFLFLRINQVAVCFIIPDNRL